MDLLGILVDLLGILVDLLGILVDLFVMACSAHPLQFLDEVASFFDNVFDVMWYAETPTFTPLGQRP